MTRSRVSKQNYSHAELTNVPNLGRRNLVINGAIQVSQRVGTTVSSGNNYGPMPDRFRTEAYATSTYQQSSDAPPGFTASLKVNCNNSTLPPGGSNTYRIQHGIEGQNIAHLQYGTASAKAATLSFYVKSAEAGLYSVALVNARPGNNSSNIVNATRSHIKTYTINSANTWEYKTLTYPGCPDGTWGTSNSDGISIVWGLGSGSDHHGAADTWLSTSDTEVSNQVTLGDNNGASWQITGIQFEEGSQATSFEHRSFAEELTLCQRYLHTVRSGIVGFCAGTNGIAYWTVDMKPKMRATPTVTCTTNSYRYGDVVSIGVAMTGITVVTNGYSSPDAPIWYVTGSASATPVQYRNQLLEPTTSAHGTFFIDAEL